MAKAIGKITAAQGNMITVDFGDQEVRQNEVAFIHVDETIRLKAEVIRIRQRFANLQVFEPTEGVKVGQEVHFTGEMLSVELGPGLLSSIFDGLQNPLPELAKKTGFFLQRGVYENALSRETKWDFTPTVKVGDTVLAGDELGWVPEKHFQHKIMVPFTFPGDGKVKKIIGAGSFSIDKVVAIVADASGKEHECKMYQTWPVKIPIGIYEERLLPETPLVTRCRIIDTLFPIAKGGTYCIPGPFGAGKTVLQQITSRYADVDVVIIAACGERAGEVVETIREFPTLDDPKTGGTLSDRTIIICNTSSMPVAAREASVYVATTMGEYYRQMGLDILLLADSTSRWAQALREMSGRLEEIPGEEAFPAYLKTTISAFYERAGIVRLRSGKLGSVTIGGTVSPAGGNFDEPVTQNTLAVVGGFHGLTWERSNARRFPAIDPIISWSKYLNQMAPILNELHPEWVNLVKGAIKLVQDGNTIKNRMAVIGEEGTSMQDFIRFLKAELFDFVYMQQNAFDDVDKECNMERQKYMFLKLNNMIDTEMDFPSKDKARDDFLAIQTQFINLNSSAWDTEQFAQYEKRIEDQFEQMKKK